jgi:hypothetical protein
MSGSQSLRLCGGSISAHDTTLGHTFSTLALMSSITLDPLAELLLAAAVFSHMKLLVSSNRIDASQPWMIIVLNEAKLSELDN